MEAAEPIHLETPKLCSKIDFFEKIIVNNEKDNYKIQLGIIDDNLLIKVESEKSKNIYYYQQCFSINELQNISMVFSMYKTLKEIIAFLKDLKYEIEEKNENLVIKFNIFMPNGKNKLIEIELKKCMRDTNFIINYLLEKIKSLEVNIKNSEEDYKIEKIKNESEIRGLKEIISKNQSEIKNLKENNLNIKNENKKLWEEIDRLKKYHAITNQKENKIINFDSKIIQSKDSISFILDYIKQNDKTFNFNNIKLLFRGSRDGERTKTCHELCDNKQNVLIIMKSETGYIFGGYSKVGFKVNNNFDYKIDNNCFLFSLNLNKIYPVIKDKKVICHIEETKGLCFYSSLSFYDYFMSKKQNKIMSDIQKNFILMNYKNNFSNKYDKSLIILKIFMKSMEGKNFLNATN